MKKLALGLSGALAMMCSPADAQTQIVIAADNAFFNQTNDIVATVEAYYFTIHNLSYDASIVATDSPQLAANIIAGTFYPDLFISAVPKQVEDLKRHPTLNSWSASPSPSPWILSNSTPSQRISAPVCPFR
jgi:hypothetical protein